MLSGEGIQVTDTIDADAIDTEAGKIGPGASTRCALENLDFQSVSVVAMPTSAIRSLGATSKNSTASLAGRRRHKTAYANR